MMEELVEKYEITNSVGEHIGKIKEIYLDLDKWEIVAFKASPGALKKSFLVNISDIVKVDTTEMKLIAKDEITEVEVPEIPTKNLYPYNDLQKVHVVDSEGEKVGKITSLEIPYDKLKKFKVWKILIKTGFKDRRLRLAPTEIGKVMEEIHLVKTLESYQETE